MHSHEEYIQLDHLQAGVNIGVKDNNTNLLEIPEFLKVCGELKFESIFCYVVYFLENKNFIHSTCFY